MLEKFQGKKIAVLGLGTNNRKLADFFSKHGLKFDVIEWETPDQLVGKIDKYDIVFRSPGLPYLSAAITQALAAGVVVSSQTKLFFELCPAPIIGVTGTKGKGTTSSLIAKILTAARKKVWLGGNIGTDPFEFIEEIQPQDSVVLELSSFQLQDLDVSPHIAVVLSITPDHLNHHKNFEEYIRAKSNIISSQKSGDVAILHPSLPDWFKQLGNGQKVFIDPSKVKNFERKILGEHNLDNIAAAFELANVLDIPEQTVKTAVAVFEPLPHRLNTLGQKSGVTYVDDTYSTNVEPAIAAIDAVEGKLVLIVGGSDKNLDFNKLGDKIKNSPKIKAVVVIGDVTDKILLSLKGFEGQILTGAKTMAEILSQAQSVAVSSDMILFSPATASFGIFKNEKDRGDQFVKAFESL